MTKPTPKKELSYYLTLFTLQGHTTWRAHLSGMKDGFQVQWDKDHPGIKPTVLQKNVVRIDRLTGQIIPLQ